ncbi:MAG: DNA-directed RNA polymerase subunit omega [Clostridiales bacterium]|nr:DNA-directed RNA polymerase subunit omega [Clostridiales bacterium]
MIHPSYTELMDVVNGEIEEGEDPVVQSRYSIVIASARRARQIIDGSEPLVANAAGKKPLSIAVEELYEGKVKILGSDESDDDDELTLDYNNDVLDLGLGEEVDEAKLFDDEDESEDDEDSDDDDYND